MPKEVFSTWENHFHKFSQNNRCNGSMTKQKKNKKKKTKLQHNFSVGFDGNTEEDEDTYVKTISSKVKQFHKVSRLVMFAQPFKIAFQRARGLLKK
jgi:hypothetical protein